MKRFLSIMVLVAPLGLAAQESAAGCGGGSYGGYGYARQSYYGSYDSYGAYARRAYPASSARRPAPQPFAERPSSAGPAFGFDAPVQRRPTFTPSPSFTPPPVRPSLGGGGRPSGPPTIGDASQLPAGTQLKFENGRLQAFDSQGRFLGNVRQ